MGARLRPFHRHVVHIPSKCATRLRSKKLFTALNSIVCPFQGLNGC